MLFWQRRLSLSFSVRKVCFDILLSSIQRHNAVSISCKFAKHQNTNSQSSGDDGLSSTIYLQPLWPRLS